MIEDSQIDICYHFPTSQLQIFINAELTTDYYFNPARMVFNQINMVTLAADSYEKWKKRKKSESEDTTTE